MGRSNTFARTDEAADNRGPPAGVFDDVPRGTWAWLLAGVAGDQAPEVSYA